MKVHYADIGIVNMIRQRLKDIELQRWLSEINNDTRKDANQKQQNENLPVIKNDGQLQMWRLPTSGHQYETHNSSNKTTTEQPQISHRDRTLFETV